MKEIINPKLSQLKQLLTTRSQLSIADCDGMTLGATGSREASEGVMAKLTEVNAEITALTSQGIGVGTTLRWVNTCNCGHVHPVILGTDGQEHMITGYY